MISEVQSLAFLKGGGEMGDRIRAKDWSSTPIGTPDQWPQSLRTSVNILLNSQLPMFVWWGKELTTIYNDAYSIVAGEKHPDLLGKSGQEGWAEIWPDLDPLVKSVFSGTATWSEDQVLYINRYGYVEETYFTFSYSPVTDEGGAVAGLFCACIETTEKVLAARKIQESERNLRNTILQSPVAMCILKGPSFTVEIANARMFELWGRGSGQLLHQPIFDGLPEARHQGLEELLQQVYTGGAPVFISEQPVLLPRHDRVEPVYINFVYQPFKEGNGTISGVIVVAIDVTEQVLARRQLEAHEAELQKRVEERTADLQRQKVFTGSILDASFNGIYALKTVRDASGAIIDFEYLFVNNNIAQTLGLQVEEVIGASMLTLIPENRTNGFFDLFCRVLHSGETVHDVTFFEARNLKNWYDYVVVPIDREVVVVTIQDISEQKNAALQMEQQRNLLDNILKCSSNGISVTEMIRDEKGQVYDARTLLANEAAVQYTGLSRDIYLSKTAVEVDPHIINSAYGQTCLKTLATGEPSFIQYYLEMTGRWLELTISKMDDDHLIHIFTDVTSIKETQLQLERLVEDLKRSNASLEEFAYAASHDMKEPIRKIHFFSDRLKGELKNSLNDTQVRLFERMEEAARRMGLLIEDLLAYSRAARGGAAAEELDLNKKVQVVLNDLELEVQQKGAQVVVDPLPTIKGHRRQMQQLFQNLISNALKYSKPGQTPEIHITARKVKGSEAKRDLAAEAAQKTYHLIEIRDNGIGFEQKDAERIFNIFTRLHGNAEYRGTGVGLSIVRKVAESHNGYVWAESVPGEGATFKVLLPAE
jgi:PAS domain S-box-containing protein